jgi:glucosamine kinase
MILVADSGSTKTEWSILGGQGNSQTVITSGINPFYQDSDNIATILKKEFTAAKTFDAIYFYGTGCINKEKQDIVKTGLLQLFTTGYAFIGSDLLAAAHSLCQDKPGFACILGTGSNSCYYNGSEIVANVSPLGFILGDEGSGAVLGRKLIGDVLKKQLPSELIDRFFESYHTTAAEILENVYKKPFPSRYLATYAQFISKNLKHPEIENIVLTSFHEFVTRNLLLYPEINQAPIHFTGSIAFYFEEQLRRVLEEKHLELGNIVRTPMKGLIDYHNSKVNL